MKAILNYKLNIFDAINIIVLPIVINGFDITKHNTDLVIEYNEDLFIAKTAHISVKPLDDIDCIIATYFILDITKYEHIDNTLKITFNYLHILN